MMKTHRTLEINNEAVANKIIIITALAACGCLLGQETRIL